MAFPLLFTFGDCVEMLTDYLGGSPITVEQRAARNAVIMAYNDLTAERSWRYFYKHARIHTSAPVTSGTITYDHTGHAAGERALIHSATNWTTLASWAAGARVVVGDVVARISSISSGTPTVAFLDEQLTFPADIAAGTSYTLYRAIYDLPIDFRAIHSFHTENKYRLSWTSFDQWMDLERTYATTSGTGWTAALTGSEDVYGQKAVALWPYPDAAETLDYVYQRYPRDLRFTGWGTAETAGTITNSGAAVTGSGSSFSSNMVGAILRFGTSSALPTSLAGGNPYADQAVVASVASSTSLTLDRTPATNYSAVKYTISDPMDLHRSQLPALVRGAEYQLAMVLGKDSQQKFREYQYALNLAKQGDADMLDPRRLADSEPIDWMSRVPIGEQEG